MVTPEHKEILKEIETDYLLAELGSRFQVTLFAAQIDVGPGGRTSYNMKYFMSPAMIVPCGPSGGQQLNRPALGQALILNTEQRILLERLLLNPTSSVPQAL